LKPSHISELESLCHKLLLHFCFIDRTSVNILNRLRKPGTLSLMSCMAALCSRIRFSCFDKACMSRFAIFSVQVCMLQLVRPLHRNFPEIRTIASVDGVYLASNVVLKQFLLATHAQHISSISQTQVEENDENSTYDHVNAGL
jgi:hypothetical protein